MSEPDVVDGQPRRRGRPWFVGCGGAVVAVVALLVGQYAYFSYQAERRLRETVAAVEAKDPRWQLADLEFDREQIPFSENAALVVLATRALLPPSGVPPTDLDVPGKGVEPPHRLREATATPLKALLEKHTDAVAKARTLADLDRGRYPITYTPDVISTLLPHAQQARQVAWLLTADAAWRGDAGDIDGALRSARAAMVCGRSLGDEPFAVSQLVRLACVTIGSAAVERALNQGEAGDAEMAAVQALWRKEAAGNLMRQVLRGERACLNETAWQIHSGNLPLGRLTGNGPTPNTASERLALLFRRNSLRVEHARLLEMMTRQVEIAEGPLQEQPERFDELEQEVTASPGMLVKLLLPAMAKLAGAVQRHRASVRSLDVLVAAERYRKANGRWPESVAALVPAYLPEVPLDPYDGKPIRMKRTDYGLVVYCLSPDRKDDGGRILPERPQQPGTDVGFRLWDVDRRRQSPPPPPPDELGPVAPPGLPQPEPPQ